MAFFLITEKHIEEITKPFSGENLAKFQKIIGAPRWGGGPGGLGSWQEF